MPTTSTTLCIALTLASQSDGVDVSMTGFVSERAQLTVPSLTAPMSTRDVALLHSITELSGLLKLRMLDERVSVVVDASAFIIAQGGYADRNAAGSGFDTVADHDVVGTDPRVVFAEAYARWQVFENLDVTVGKRRVVWGTGMTFNPTDTLNPPRDPTDPSLQRTGVPLALVEVPLSGFALSALFAPAIITENAGIPSAMLWDDDDNARFATALRGYVLVADTDVNVWGVVHNSYGQDPRESSMRLALSLSRVFDIHEVHVEALVQSGSDRVRVNRRCVGDDHDATIFAIASCGLSGDAIVARDRAFDDALLPRFIVGTRSMFGDGTVVGVEWLYQADGLTQREWRDLVQLQATVGDFVRRGALDTSSFTSFLNVGTDASGQPARLAVTPLRRHHLIVTYSRPQIFDDFTINVTGLVAAEDLSAIATASVQWQATEWLQVSAWLFQPLPSPANALHRAGINHDVLWPAIVDGVPYGEYDIAPFSTRGMLELRAWF